MPTPLENLVIVTENLQKHVKTLAEALRVTNESTALLNEEMEDLHLRLLRLENKTHGLSDRPSVNTCPHCHRKVQTATGSCGFCGARVQ